jgi:purine-binding chemotaxis protein CheW
MNGTDQILVFTIKGIRFGLRLAVVERVLRMVEVTPVPEASDIVTGLLNLQGRVVPVLNVRKKFRLPDRDMALDDQLIVAHTAGRPIALPADSVTGVCECPEQELIGAKEILPGMDHFQGVMKLKGDLVFIYDLDGFLSSEEEERISQNLSERGCEEIKATGATSG